MKSLLLAPASAGLLLLSLLPAPARAQHDGALRKQVRIPQDQITAGEIPLHQLFYTGAHLFTNRFTTEDGFGEAPDGPRRRKQRLAANPLTPFLRFNGLDAQSCQECHGNVGFAERDGFSIPRETSVIGGSGGFSANVFIFEDPDNLREGIVRNPPHVFGLGYIQRLADEMTQELQQQVGEISDAAFQSGVPVRRELRAKGVSFGYLTVNPVGGMDRSELQGVSMDFVVRPFQFKGVASSLRNFVAGAMNFHFSVQPRELMLRHFIPDDNPSGALKHDVQDELLEGEVSAVAVFLAALRPPAQDPTGLDPLAVARGRALMDATGCTVCHVPSLTIHDPRVTILDPRYLPDMDLYEQKYVSLAQKIQEEIPQMVAARPESEFLDPMVLYAWTKKSRDRTRPPGYTLDLNSSLLPDESYPRITPKSDGTVDVPLFSDLRRHRMGRNLRDTVPQRTDMQSIFVPEEEFLTRPLWGVADTGPWLHDGRATTLREAIELHAGDGSEANPSIAQFHALTPADQDALLAFLRSLRVQVKGHPMEPGVVHREGFTTY